MSNFTPGPWEAKQKYIGISVFDSNGDGVANVCQSYGDTPYKVWANARLIAAAPEMYELLREFLQGLGDFITEIPDEAIERAEALLRRINGEEI